MSRLTIDISPEQHKSLKAMAALEGKTIRQYALERLFPRLAINPADLAGDGEQGPRTITPDELIDKDAAAMDEAEKAAWANFSAFLEQRAAEAQAGAVANRTPQQILDAVFGESRDH